MFLIVWAGRRLRRRPSPDSARSRTSRRSRTTASTGRTTAPWSRGTQGFGLVGKFAFDGAYDAARNSAADYLKHAKNQLGRWQTQLNEGAKVIRDATDKSTLKK
ncbi:hypothetical protein [Nonomuraea sp. NPDC052265]|uniref:hypothetical protein n=1 Tax=Nonomuraea sp. NPDC052265 TaxID=3364374 RepID=UPI0037CBF978